MAKKSVSAFVAEVGQHEGAQGIQSIAEHGYRGDVPEAILADFDGNDSTARGAIRAACYEIYASDGFERV